jgi:Tfp pilus assembly protein PilF
MKKIFWLGFLALLLNTAKAQQTVSVKEYQKEFTTYPFSDPDPVPNFSAIYPYFRFDGFTDQPIQKKWKVIEIENDYIQIMILPEIGGKIWAAIDKKTNKPFLYYNHAVKFRDVALRGPWTSGGLEANYGIIGHTPNCATPVDYTILKKADGSISCVIGGLDLLSSTNWRLDINLEKDKAYFTTSSFWYNTTPNQQPYYHWMNAGLKADGNLEFIYPGNKYLGHNGEYNDWPINKTNGKNLAFYNNNNFGGYKSYHVFGAYTNFFGAYYHDDDFGMVRYANHNDKAGKKIWIWGLSRQGMIWEKYLTDTDKQYVEVQSGRMFNQNAEQSTFSPFKHRSFEPYATDTWKEYWYGVKKTKGISAATDYGAVNLVDENGKLKIYLFPVKNCNDELLITQKGKIIYQKMLTLAPQQNFVDSIVLNKAAGNIEFSLGAHKINYNSDPSTAYLSRPVETLKNFNWNTAYGNYLQGKELMDQRQYPAAAIKLEASIKIDSNFLPSLVKYAELKWLNFQNPDALKLLQRALSIDAHDGAANYYYGLVQNAFYHTVDAMDGFDLASLSPEYRGAAYTELAKIYCNKKDYQKSISYCKEALVQNTHNIKALELQAINERLLKDSTAAKNTWNHILDLDPLNHTVDFENFLTNPSEASFQQFKNNLHNEMPAENYLELAASYRELNLLEDAELAVRYCENNTIAKYWNAYFLMLQKKPYEKALEEANAASPDFVFPSRRLDLEVFMWAMIKGQHWKPLYYFALILKSKNTDEAGIIKLFDAFTGDIAKSRGEVINYAPFYATRSKIYASKFPEKAIADLQKAISIDKEGWRYYKSLTEIYNQQKQYKEALKTIEPFYLAHPQQYIIGMLYAKTLLFNHQYAASDKLLTGLQIIPFEGSTQGHELYRQSKLMQALEFIEKNEAEKAITLVNQAKEYPENLGAGKPYDADLDTKLEDKILTAAKQKPAVKEIDALKKLVIKK